MSKTRVTAGSTVNESGTGNNYGFENETGVSPAMYDLYEQTFDKLAPKVGKEVEGTLLSVTSRQAVVDFGGKSPVIVDIDSNEKTCLAEAEIGSKLTVMITNITEKRNVHNISGSVYASQQLRFANQLHQHVKDRTIFTGNVERMNHVGYIVSIPELGSVLMPHLLADVNRLPDPESLVGQPIQFVLEYHTKDNALPFAMYDVPSFIASRKAYLESFAQIEISNLVKGDVYEGFATGTTSFAVFVQFKNCLTCMIHKSNLSPDALKALEAGEIQPGTPFQFYLKEIIKNKIFGTMIPRESWNSLWDTIKVRETMVGKVASLKDFGILVELDYETKGLLHSSVLEKNYLTKYKVGDKVKVAVTAVNKNNRQITLALA